MIYRIIIVILSALVSVLVHFPELISMLNFDGNFNPFGKITIAEISCEIGYLFITLLILFAINGYLFKFYNKKHIIKWSLVFISFIITWILSSLLGHLFILLRDYIQIPAINVTLHHYLHPLRDFIISFVVTGGSYIMYLVARDQSIVLENQELRTENLRNQYESLKNQLNPHMLFNSLNTLNILIRESPQKAQNYTCELSKVLRYTLQTSESKCVTLVQEMAFVDAYIFLLKQRYEENLNFVIRIDKMYEGYYIPPMAVQMLIENGVKHNEISSKRPMEMTICTDEERLTVSNPIQPKISTSKGDGIGLNNLNKRYNLLFKQDILISIENNIYKVILPLAKHCNESSNN